MRRLTLQIRTPEGVTFHQTLAGPMARFLAWLIDFVVTLALVYALNALLAVLQWISAEIAQAVAVMVMFALNIGYGMALEWLWRGQTFGKRVMRLRVMDAEGLRLRFSQIALRNLLRGVDLLPLAYAVGGLCALVSPLGQRLGDLAGGTIVVRIPHTPQPDIDQLVAGRFNSLRAFPHIVSRLRQQASPAEATLALQALLRREELVDAERVHVFAEIASHFRTLAAFPPEATEGVTDEQYLRNVVDVLFRASAKAASPAPSPGQEAAAT
ncbi:MAG: RDD family protein [Verrucomicrobia bacterium]|nr:RDD family protein [Verrucomicrobiota bacterium]MBI3870307.1 RDD family protein [Verrucomicrobiota bacterium]